MYHHVFLYKNNICLTFYDVNWHIYCVCNFVVNRSSYVYKLPFEIYFVYQWVPIILMFQAFLFKVPNIAWKLMNAHSGIRIDKICLLADTILLSSPDDRKQNISQMATYIHNWIYSQQNYKHNICANCHLEKTVEWCLLVNKSCRFGFQNVHSLISTQCLEL
jgi:hypothetical protein